MERVGIINFHRAINYGAVLQSYALQENIKKIGFEPVTLDYKSIPIERAYDLFKLNYRAPKGFLLDILKYPRRKRKWKKFNLFRLKYLTLEPICDIYSKESTEYLRKYKIFITGSDQVWNCTLTDFDTAYFLDFVSENHKKSSYAASFGFDQIPDECVQDYFVLLQQFNNISVREQDGAVIIKKLLNRQVEVLLDPTMLLLKEDWIRIAKEYPQEDYILLYQLVDSKSLRDFSVTLSNETGYEIIYICDDLRKRIKARYVAGVGPQEFLGLFKNAAYVVTNSFHGIAFSIVFNKPFFVEKLLSPAIVNSRLENILETFELESREVINGKNKNLLTDIDYVTVNRKLDMERERSINYLKRILEE